METEITDDSNEYQINQIGPDFDGVIFIGLFAGYIFYMIRIAIRRLHCRLSLATGIYREEDYGTLPNFVLKGCSIPNHMEASDKNIWMLRLKS